MMNDMFDTEEYNGGMYESPLEYEEQEDEDFDYGSYIDYVYDSYKDEMLLREMEENNE